MLFFDYVKNLFANYFRLVWRLCLGAHRQHGFYLEQFID